MAVTKGNSEVKLRRVRSLGDLIIYGIILIQPVAALPLFGHANTISEGHAVTTMLIAMVAMIFTAISYGMGRDSVIPKKVFGHLSKKSADPNYNVLFIGGGWMLAGIIYLAIRTKGFRKATVMIDFSNA